MNKFFVYLLPLFLHLCCGSVSATLNDVDSQQMGQEASVIQNGGFENALAGYFVYGSTAELNTFTDTGDLVTANGHALSNGDKIIFSSITSTTGISTNIVYYVISVTTNTFQVALTSGGSAIALTTNGSGTFIREKPVAMPTASASNLTLDKTTSSPFEGKLSGTLAKGAANRFGEGFGKTFSTLLATGQLYNITFAYSVSSGTFATGDATAYLFDATSGLVLSTLELRNVSDKVYALGQFRATTSTSYGVVISVSSVSASAWTLKLDSFRATPQQPQIIQTTKTDFVGESYIQSSTNCQWARASTTVGQFGTDADCPGPTIVTSNLGTWLTTDSDLPRQSINGLPDGIYEVTIIAPTAMNIAQGQSLAISDGTTTCEPQMGNSNSAGTVGVAVTCSFTYTNGGNRFFELYGGSPSQTININNNLTTPRASLKFIIKRYARNSEVSVSPLQSDFPWTSFTPTGSWVSNTTYTGKWKRIGDTAYIQYFISLSGAPTSTALTLEIPNGETIDTAKIADGSPTSETYLKSIGGLLDSGSSSFPLLRFRYVDTNTVAVVHPIVSGSSVLANATTQAAPITFANGDKIWLELEVPIKNWPENNRAATLNGSVTSGSSGAERLERAKLTNGGSCAIASQSGTWIQSVSDPGAGLCDMNITGAFSASPTCVCSTNGNARLCNILEASTSVTNVRVQTVNTSFALTDEPFNIICFGPR